MVPAAKSDFGAPQRDQIGFHHHRASQLCRRQHELAPLNTLHP
jgi:hypothetical protein